MAEDEKDFPAEAEIHRPDIEVLPAVRRVEVNLFGGGDPAEVVKQATEVATALAAVVDKQQLFTVINQRKHVRVEGWTLLGSMLGVFPVVEWTRQIVEGWEARVNAQTLGGDIAGSAEAMCTRKESKWKTRDEYAIRSMAQTRATSKALRLPLGFVMTLAGYDATPAEEMGIEETSAQPEPASAEFDPGQHLLPGAPHGDGALEKLAEQMRQIDPTLDWRDLTKQIEGERDGVFWRRLSNAVTKLTDGRVGDFPPPEKVEVVAAFAWAFEGQTVQPHEAEKGDAPLGDAAPVKPDETIGFDQGAYGEDRP